MKSNNALKVLSFYWRHARRYPRLIWPVSIVVPITVFVNNYAPPLILAVVINRLSQHHFTPHHVWNDFGTYLVMYALLAVFGGFIWRIVDACNWRLEGNVQRDVAQETFKHLTGQGADFHANSFVGSLVSHTTKLLGSYVRIADTTMFQVLPMLWGIIFACIIMAFRAPVYSLLLLLFATFYIISSFFVTRTVRRLGAEEAVAESAQTGSLADALTNVMAIKSFARESEERKRFAAATDNTFSKLMLLMRASQRQLNFFGVASGLLDALALIIAVVSVVSLHANLGTAFLIFNYTATISNQLFSFSNNSLRTYNRALGDALDMVETLELVPEIADPKQPQVSRMTRGTISFKDVTFTHSGADEAIFNKFSLNIKDGEKIGLVGHSGSGKTTFTRLLLRFSDIDSGSISINGQNISKVAQSDLHRSIAYVPQEPLLFHRSIAENIGYGQDKFDQSAINTAADRAHATEFIDTLPKGYDTLVGERGVKLSGGQRQRVVIARAMLKNAPILLLDEATSALDSESEVLIQDALWKLMEGRTAIVIAHRLSTIQKMDRIVVLDQGRIVEEGSHKELLRKQGTYAKLWAHQSGGFIED
jgi:ATP-binding cassette subfamily B protein